jgi:polygalacturonase
MNLRFCRRLLPIILLSVNAWSAAPHFNILDYGARNDGSTPATEAFQAAIQAAKAAGGGTVYVPAGKYICGPIALVSNLVLHIDAGATLQFPAQNLPFTQGRNQGIECLTPVPLIGGHDLENVTITGRGTITTNNADWMKLKGPSAGIAGEENSRDGGGIPEDRAGTSSAVYSNHELPECPD